MAGSRINLNDPSIPITIREFLTYAQTIQGKSAKTVYEYFLDLRTFFRYIVRQREDLDCDYTEVDLSGVTLDLIRSITFEDCFHYLMYVTQERQNLSAARARKVSSLKSFYHYLHQKVKSVETDPTENLDFPKQRKSLPKYLDLNESKQLLSSIDTKHYDRDYCIVTLFLNCGMRISELVGLNLNDYNPTEHTLRLLGKGNKERIVYTNEACDQALAAWLSVRPHQGLRDPNALFISQQKRRLSVKTIQQMIPKVLAEAGLSGRGFSAHKLRHTAATLMYRYGEVDVRVLQEILGHESLATTEIYTHVVNQDLHNAIESNPLADFTAPEKDKEKKED